MGNRAVITTLGNPNGVYLHWNGGRDSVAPLAFYAYNFIADKPTLEAFAYVAERCGLHPEKGNLGELDCDNGDNGLYLIQGGEIVGRAFMRWEEQSAHDFDDFVLQIDCSMPKERQKGADFLLKYLASDPLVDEWGNLADLFGLMEAGKITQGATLLYKGEWVKIAGYRKGDEPIGGKSRKGQPFFAPLGKNADERDPACYFDLTPEGRINDTGLRLWIEPRKSH